MCRTIKPWAAGKTPLPSGEGGSPRRLRAGPRQTRRPSPRPPALSLQGADMSHMPTCWRPPPAVSEIVTRLEVPTSEFLISLAPRWLARGWQRCVPAGRRPPFRAMRTDRLRPSPLSATIPPLSSVIWAPRRASSAVESAPGSPGTGPGGWRPPPSGRLRTASAPPPSPRS